MSGLLKLLGLDRNGKEDKEDIDTPEYKQDRRYHMHVEDNPHETKYRCRQRDIISPACKLTLHLEGIEASDMREIQKELYQLLEDRGFYIR